MSSTERDPDTGRLLYPLQLVVNVDGALPTHVSCANWDAAASYLTSPEFAAARDRASSVTISNWQAGL